ncbi:MAG TPA: hypothetical protein IAB65_03230 [Candidatus Onthocola stercorigallinarum]|nr:hypothetical protein [Candidatus Onthocola stercorigallinarum]
MEEGINVTNEVTNEQNKKGGNKKKTIIIVCIIVLLVIIAAVCIYFFLIRKSDNEENNNNNEVNNETEVINTNSPYKLTSNGLEPFDLYFMQLENNGQNKVYSPLSIKYALAMLSEGANGKTKEQIDNIIGEYTARKYNNSDNMSFANSLFIKDTYQDSIKSSYINTVASKYNADVIIDSFRNADTLNSWISDKTFNLITNITDDISYLDFILVNALAIDMEWVEKIQSEHEIYSVNFPHEKANDENYDYMYSFYIYGLNTTDYNRLEFEGVDYEVKSAQIGAIANNYDIINILGEDSIKQTVREAFEQYQEENPGTVKDRYGREISDFDSWFDNYYIKELGSNYGHISSSTDFEFYVDDNTKVFAKDLKEYDGTTLQYVGIMPTNENLDNFIENMNASDINTLINNLKPIELDSFKEGYVTEITGYIPMFKMDYELDLISDLQKLGITSVFDESADLSNITNDNAYITDAKHSANIEFSNDGIKAAAATMVGGAGDATGPFFDYYFEVPIETIDLTFDRPFMYLIRDKETGEVWFAGTVYEPIDISEYEAELEEYMNDYFNN